MFSLQVKSYTTVSSSYSWDHGDPATAALSTVYSISDQGFVGLVGYAPYMRVEFGQNGKEHVASGKISSTVQTEIGWNFDDSYNIANTRQTTIQQKTRSISHTFLMPGVYSVSYIAGEVFKIFTTPVYDPTKDTCNSQNLQWRWDDMQQGKSNGFSWNHYTIDDTPKTWLDRERCIDAYCVNWSWYYLSSSSQGSLQWFETEHLKKYTRTWNRQGLPDDRICPDLTYNYILSTTYTSVYNPDAVITVLEIAPQANLFASSVSSDNTIILNPQGCVCGSFAFDRIDWDLDDGTDIITVNRNDILSLTSKNTFILYNSAFSEDFFDPRNFSIRYQYSNITKEVYYPSITAYSANTDTSDSCSCPVVVVSRDVMNIDNFKVINARVESRDVVYTSTYNNNVVFHTHSLDLTSNTTTTQISSSLEQLKHVNLVTLPKNKIRNYPGKLVDSNGYTGSSFVYLLSNTVSRMPEVSSLTTIQDMDISTEEDTSIII